MGQLFAPRAFGSNKCVVRAFVVRPDGHSFIHVFLSRPLKPPETYGFLEEFGDMYIRARFIVVA